MDAVWALLLATAAVVVITYSRLPPEELYNVSEEGLKAGFGRALVFLNYPTSLVAIAIAWLAADRIGTRRAFWAAAVATLLCAVTAWPGVVDQHDLDAKPVNVLPALGVAIALVLSVRAAWERSGPKRLDPWRIAIAVVMVLAAIPWLSAVLGFYVPGDVFLGEETRRHGDGTLGSAVHLGDHEGLDGTLLALAALVLSRLRPRAAVAFVLGLMLVYGLGVAFSDFWFEQVVKRGWTEWRPPNPLTPSLSFTWLLVVVLAAVAAVLLRRYEGPARPAGGPPRTWPSPARGRRSGGSTTDEPSP